MKCVEYNVEFFYDVETKLDDGVNRDCIPDKIGHPKFLIIVSVYLNHAFRVFPLYNLFIQ